VESRKPHSDYAISKYGAEMEIWRGQQEGLDVIIVNPGIIIGPGFQEQGSGQLLRRLLTDYGITPWERSIRG
jgi:nucleoside-diphosphate-sugar epimerase